MRIESRQRIELYCDEIKAWGVEVCEKFERWSPTAGPLPSSLPPQYVVDAYKHVRELLAEEGVVDSMMEAGLFDPLTPPTAPYFADRVDLILQHSPLSA